MIKQLLGFKKVAKQNGCGVHGVHCVHHEALTTKHQRCARDPLVICWLISRPMIRKTDLLIAVISLAVTAIIGWPISRRVQKK